ncbi:GH25 family lysozyme [Apilactobacillus timberlakei]|uniref:Autolysin n=2 Tax=Apilactobacillus timberlakei TaxID=2008380 RepID=A0ABY2YRA2_9LACO|nr:GH25 family lysozyme [Apilactobacillus timberlakei]TPR12410.1 autolysin [Apilactobacillus timberlakei]
MAKTKNYDIVADISSYQDKTLAYLHTLKNNGVKGVMVKLTDSTNYLNPNAAQQVTNAFKVGVQSVGLYHYYQGQPLAEAQYFLKWVKAFGMDKDTPLAIDVEDPYSLPQYNTAGVNIFLNELKKAGYVCRVTYSSSSWFNAGRVNYAKLNDKNIWVASYGSSQPNVDNSTAWQFTDNYKRLGVDGSYDFDGTLMGKRFKYKAPAKPKKETPKPNNNYLASGSNFLVLTDHLNVYNSAVFDQQNRTEYNYAKGSVFTGKLVKYGNIYRIQTKDGYYVSANADFIKQVK